MTDNYVTFTDSLNGVVTLYNLTKKIFLNGCIYYKKSSFNVIKGLTRNNLHNGSSSVEQLDTYQKKRVKKRREKIVDLALNNEWDYFVTLTFDNKQLGGSYSHEKAINKLINWLSTQRKQNPNIRYLLVAEFHHTSERLHFHGLFANAEHWRITPKAIQKDSLTQTNLIIANKPIYTLDNYKLGFVEISKVESQEKVSNYISKYVTKELITLKNKKVFWHSRNLNIPQKTYHFIDEKLEEYLRSQKIDYYKEFNKNNCSIELAYKKGNIT